MSLGRRKVRLDDPAAWVFNRMVEGYAARPAYPASLIDSMARLAGAPGARVGDLGAGMGHVALPLAARGYEVIAVEPAEGMLRALRDAADSARCPLQTLHAAVEALPIADASLDLAVVADALHFMDAERAGREIGRVLAPGGALALVTCTFAPTPFMRELAHVMEEAAPRRPRDVEALRVQLAAVARVSLGQPVVVDDAHAVDAATLVRILRSISYIGPAMNPVRFAAFVARVMAIREPAVWARRFHMWSGARLG